MLNHLILMATFWLSTQSQMADFVYLDSAKSKTCSILQASPKTTFRHNQILLTQLINNTASSPGVPYHSTIRTWQNAIPMAPPAGQDAGLGQTFPRNEPLEDLPPPATTYLLAPLSKLDVGPIPSGTFSFGFPISGRDSYHGPYLNALNFGGYLEPTSTASVDIDIVDCPFCRLHSSNPGSPVMLPVNNTAGSVWRGEFAYPPPNQTPFYR